MENEIANLSTEVLLKILTNLRLKDLAALRATCKRFRDIIDQWASTILNDFHCTKADNAKFLNRCYSLLSSFERLRVGRNWRKARYKESNILATKIRYLPWLSLQKGALWISKGSELKAYDRTATGVSAQRAAHTIRAKSKEEICRFSLKNDRILAGLNNGGLFMWSIREKRFQFDLADCHVGNTDSCDFSNELVASASYDVVKLWHTVDYLGLEEVRRLEFVDRVWNLSLFDSLLAVGTAGNQSLEVVSVYDTKSAVYTAKLQAPAYGAGVLDVQWETPHLLWTCGYDSYLRRWDLRSGRCVQRFMDPCNAAVYCFQLDFGHAMLTGTQTNGRAVLWDARQPGYVQMYFTEMCKRRERSSPIYALAFDRRLLFAHTDRHLNVLDFGSFEANRGDERDYGGLFTNAI